MQNIRKYYFPVQDDHVSTGLCPSGQFAAWLEQTPLVRGYGATRLEAIADLVETLRIAAELDEQA